MDHQGLPELRISLMREKSGSSHSDDLVGEIANRTAVFRLRTGGLMCRLPSRGSLAALFALHDTGVLLSRLSLRLLSGKKDILSNSGVNYTIYEQ